MLKNLDHLHSEEAVLLPADVEVTAKLWSGWRQVLEFSGPPRENPLFTDPHCFRRFLAAFRSARSIRAGARDEFWGFLKSPEFPLEQLLSDESGHTLDVQDNLLHWRFGTMTRGSRLASPLSRIAWALRPTTFPIYDSHCRRGMEHIAGERGFERYRDYVLAFNLLDAALCDTRELGGSPRAFQRAALSTALARIGRRFKYIYRR